MKRSQISTGDILDGRHRLLVAGLNARDNCGTAARAISAALGFSITILKRSAQSSAIGHLLLIEGLTSHEHQVNLLGLVLRRDTHLPVRVDDLRLCIRRLMRYLGRPIDPPWHSGDVAMVAIGSRLGQLEGGFAMLLRVLIQEHYPGVVYQPLTPEDRLSDAALAALGLTGRPNDRLPAWSCPAQPWTDEDQRHLITIPQYRPTVGAAASPARPIKSVRARSQS